MSAHMEDSSTGAPPVTVSGSHLQVDKVKAAYWQQFIDELSSMGVTFEDLDPDSDFKAILCETKLTPIQQGIVLKMIKERLGGTTVTGGRSGSAASSTSTAGQIEELRQEMRQEMRALRFATRQVTSPTIIPTIFTQSQFKKHLHDYQSWKSYSGPWWNSIVDFPKTSETFAQFCSVKLPAVGANEDALQAYLMQQLATLQNKKSSLLKCSFIDTHSKPLMDTTRKPDVAMLPKPMEKPSIYNLAAMISLKREIDEGAVVELAFMLLDLLTSTPRRQMISGIVTNCREWQAVWITRRDGGFEYRRSKIFELHPPNKKNEISADRQAVLQFLLQDPYAAGLNAPTTFSTGDQRWNTWQLSSGSTSTVRVGEPLIEPYKHPNVVLKQLMVRDDKRHEKFFHAECEVLQLLSEQAPPELSLCLPRLIGVIKEDWTLVVSPVGLRLHSSSITPEFVEEMFVYIKGMWKMKLVDLDLRGRNIMMVLDKSDVGHFFKVDFASVVRAGAELTEYHGTDRYAHPDILSALIKTKPGVASSSSSSSPAALQSPTSASSFSLQFIPNQSHMLYSAAATVLWLIHLSDVHKELIRAAGNDWVQLLQAWSEVRKEDIQAGELLTLAETGKVDESSRLLAKIAGTVQTSRGRSPSQ